MSSRMKQYGLLKAVDRIMRSIRKAQEEYLLTDDEAREAATIAAQEMARMLPKEKPEGSGLPFEGEKMKVGA